MARRNSLPLVHLSMFVLRFFSGLALIYYQGWTQVVAGWNYLFTERQSVDGAEVTRVGWALVQSFQAQGKTLPSAVSWAWMVAVFFFFCPLLLSLGFLSRLSALLIFVGVVMALGMDLDAVLSDSFRDQTVVLYLLIMVFFIFNGGGLLAADRLFDRRRGRIRQAGGLYSNK